MRVLPTSEKLSTPMGPFAVAIGVFDGVHLGHQALLAEAQALAKSDGIESLAFTFHPHPTQVVAPASAPRLLESVECRLERLGACGIGATLVQHFSPAFAEISAADFVRRILVERLQVKHVVVGEGYRFGNRQAGDTGLLQRLGLEHGFAVHVIEKVEVHGVQVSSSVVRSRVADGNVQDVPSLQGRPYEMRGMVVRGAQRGRTIGFATANVEPENQLIPKVGVYAAMAVGPFGVKHAVVNIGYTPTFEAMGLKVEAHLLDYEPGQLYGTPMSLEFIERLRDEKKFGGVDELKVQIHKDVEAARSILVQW